MKKVLFAVMLLAAVYTAKAQEVTVYRLSSTTNNPAKTVVVPAYIVTNFERTYPGMTVIAWEPVTSWWRATYKDNNRITQVYYSNAGDTYRVTLPVLQNNVPEDVVTSAITAYGTSLYGITRMKSSAGNEIYQVKLLEGTAPKTAWLDSKGVLIDESSVYKVKVDD